MTCFLGFTATTGVPTGKASDADRLQTLWFSALLWASRSPLDVEIDFQSASDCSLSMPWGCRQRISGTTQSSDRPYWLKNNYYVTAILLHYSRGDKKKKSATPASFSNIKPLHTFLHVSVTKDEMYHYNNININRWHVYTFV